MTNWWQKSQRLLYRDVLDSSTATLTERSAVHNFQTFHVDTINLVRDYADWKNELFQ